MTLSVHPLPVPARLGVGLDLTAAVIAAVAAVDGLDGLADGDVLVVASKVVALAEDRLVPLAPVPGDDGSADGSSGDEREDHVRRLTRHHARRVVADHPRVLVVETAHGFVCANAGIDTSNVPLGSALLLPEDPDASAHRLRQDLHDRLGVEVGIVVGDTFGRPWREGQVEVAIGVSGVLALRDERGRQDLLGTTLAVTMAAVADEVAGLADLVRDKSTPVPFVLVRGLELAGQGSGRDLVRAPTDDLFPAGGATMADHAVALAAPDADVSDLRDPRPLDGVLALVVDRLPTSTVLHASPAADGATEVAIHGPGDATTVLRVGAALEDLRILAAARGRTTTPPRAGTDGIVATVVVSP